MLCVTAFQLVIPNTSVIRMFDRNNVILIAVLLKFACLHIDVNANTNSDLHVHIQSIVFIDHIFKEILYTRTIINLHTYFNSCTYTSIYK